MDREERLRRRRERDRARRLRETAEETYFEGLGQKIPIALSSFHH